VDRDCPEVTIFSCAYCGAVPRELALRAGLRLPASVHLIEVPCLSRVQADLILSAFEAGAQGVLLVGCEDHNCHHQGGNQRAKRRFAAMAALLEQVGIPRTRLSLWQGGLGDPRAFLAELNSFLAAIAGSPHQSQVAGGSLDQGAAETTC
jgi:coenzyme F420-reducing hydrogenase delta subunit